MQIGHEKLRHAQLWSVPAVNADWLWDSSRKGELLPFASYLVQPLTTPGQSVEVDDRSEKPSVTYKKDERHDKPDPTRAFERRKSPPKERFKQLSKGPPHSMKLGSISNGFESEPGSNPKANPPRKEQNQPSAIRLDDDSQAPFYSPLEDSSATIGPPSASAPLQEITPNSSPQKR